MSINLAFLFAFIAGFVDTTTFIAAKGIFSAHITGNFVLFASALIQGPREIDFFKVLLFIPFVLAVTFAAWMNRLTSSKSKYESIMLTTAALLLLITGLYFIFFPVVDNQYYGRTGLFLMLPVLAMGIQNGLCKITSPSEPMTTVMTGNVVLLALEFFNIESTQKISGVDRYQKIVSFIKVIMGFFVGCIVAASVVSKISMGALVFPALILMGMTIFKIICPIKEN